MKLNEKYMPFKAIAFLSVLVFTGLFYSNCGSTDAEDGTRQSQENIDGVRQKIFVDEAQRLSAQDACTQDDEACVRENLDGSYSLDRVILKD